MQDVAPLLDRLRQCGVRHVNTPFASRRGFVRMSRLWAYATWSFRLRREFDVLYTYGVGRFTQFLERFLVPAGSVVWHPFGNPAHLPPIIADMPREIVTAVVAESTIHEAVVSRSFKVPVRIAVLPALTNARSPAPARSRAVSEVRVAFLGRFDANKGAVWLADRWRHLSIQPARLDFYGNGPDRPQLQQRAAESSARIAVHGGWNGAEELSAILQRTDLVVLPSLSEGVPLTLLECMANGVPFVASDVGGIPVLAEANPDVRIAPRGLEFERAIEQMAAAIRRGEIDRARLQQYFNARYAEDVVKARWCEFFTAC
ncbi:MAG: glycosyltransferase [Gemmatimonadaceae bacterium]